MNSLKVFPATLNSEGQKVPLIKGWNELATNDPSQIKLWQELYRDRLHFWGVPCGAANGIVALDIDVKKVNGWTSLAQLGFQPPKTMFQHTPSGGCHLIFKAKPGVHYSNSVNSKLGLDTRGDRGWIAYYGIQGEVLAEVPEWFGNLSPKHEPVTASASTIRLAPEIAQGIVTESLERVRTAPEGESNNVLNTESFKLGQLVASESITRGFAEQELFRVAKLRGKPDYESKATIKSGLDGGIKNPLNCPFPTIAPTSSFALPAPPEAPGRWTPQYFTRADILNTRHLRKPQLFRDWSTEDIHITTADGGTGKTTLKLFEAICLALGEPFLGFQNLKKGKTLFVTGEDTDKKLGAMLGAIMKQMGLFEERVENEEKIQQILQSIVIKKDADLCLITKDRQSFLSPNSESMRKIMEAVEDIRPSMIVFDPIASFWGSESMVNDMGKAVTKFMSELVEKSGACVEMINHMGKTSSSIKDMSQFAGRGGTGLPSNSRVSRVLRQLDSDEYWKLTGEILDEGRSAILCNVNKFSDGSPLYNKPFIIVRNGYLFSRKSITPAKAMEMEKSLADTERVFQFVKEERNSDRYPTKNIIVGHFRHVADPISESRTKQAVDALHYSGHMGEKFKYIENPDMSVREKAIVITDMEGKEI